MQIDARMHGWCRPPEGELREAHKVPALSAQTIHWDTLGYIGYALTKLGRTTK